jgi:hypothetical protein
MKLRLARRDRLAFELLGYREHMLLIHQNIPEAKIIEVGLSRKAPCQGCAKQAGVKQVGKWVAVLCDACAAAVYREGKYFCLPH